MLVEKIEELSKGRRKIILDDGNSLVLYKGELKGLHISIGGELAESDYRRIMEEILPKRAKLRGLNLLAARPYTEWQLRQKYLEGGYPIAIIDLAIDYLKQMHFIDDYEYCRTYMTYKSNSRSRKRMINDLVSKGVGRETIERALAILESDGDMEAEEELIKRLLEKKHYDPVTSSFEEKQKIMRFLYGKGFSMDSISNNI